MEEWWIYSLGVIVKCYYPQCLCDFANPVFLFCPSDIKSHSSFCHCALRSSADIVFKKLECVSTFRKCPIASIRLQ